MEWTCERIEKVMNYMRVCLGAEKIFYLDLDHDRVGFWCGNNICYNRKFSGIYEEMLDKQNNL